MAEALGIVSSIIAIVGVAGKLGTSTFKLKRLWDEVQDVPTSIQQCIEQLEILAPAIQEMESEFERTREMVQNDTAAKRSLEYSQKAMETIEALIRDMEQKIESAHRGKKLLTQLKVRLKKDVLEEHQQRLQFALQLVSLSQQTYLIAVTRAQPSIIMAEWRNLQEQERVARSSPVEWPGQDEDSASDVTAIAEIPCNNAVPCYTNWWPTVKGMPWREPGLLGSFAYRAEEQVSEKCTLLGRRNVLVHQVRLQLPRWILQKTWDFQLYRSYDGWKFQMKNWNIRPNDSPIFRFVKEGRIDLILEAFDRNEASLYDLDEDGDTLIEISAAYRHYKLIKELHMMGLKTSNLNLSAVLALVMWWIYLSHDDKLMELFELCKEGEEFNDLVNIDHSGAEMPNSSDTALLLNLRFLCPKFSMFPPQYCTRMISCGLDWDFVDPKSVLIMIDRGFARPGFHRGWDLEGFAGAYFHALLNDAQTEPWRLLARRIFAGASPKAVALPPHWSSRFWPLLCSTLAKIKWRKFPMGAFNKWLPRALSMWMEDLAEAGINLQEYIVYEISASRAWYTPLRPGIRFLESGPSLVVLNYGDGPEDWVFEWDPCMEELVGEFWNIIEFPPMPGSWVDAIPDGEDDGEPGDIGVQCYMGNSDLCSFASVRYWGEMEKSGTKPSPLGAGGVPKCEDFRENY